MELKHGGKLMAHDPSEGLDPRTGPQSGPITTIIRVPRTWWGGAALFVSVDGEYFYPVEPGPEAKLGAVFSPRSKDGTSGFIGYTKRGVLRTTEGYWQGHHDYTIDSI